VLQAHHWKQKNHNGVKLGKSYRYNSTKAVDSTLPSVLQSHTSQNSTCHGRVAKKKKEEKKNQIEFR